jgi:hypothetical protein
MAKFRKKPVVIEAILNTGAWGPIRDWLQELAGEEFGGFAFAPMTTPPVIRNADGSLSIKTLEGTMIASVGDYMICGVKGELYPCKNDIFLATYEPVKNEALPTQEDAEWHARIFRIALQKHVEQEREESTEVTNESIGQRRITND